MKFLFFVLFTVATLPSVAMSQPFFAPDQKDPKPSGKVWVAVENMSDEFDGTELDKSKWHGDPSAKGWGWVGRPPGLFKEDSITIENSMLNVTVGVLEEPVTVHGEQYKYHGGIVRSVPPGKVGDFFECRIKANRTEMSSMFWLITPLGVSPRLELDIQECVGKTENVSTAATVGSTQCNFKNSIEDGCLFFEGDSSIRAYDGTRES